MCLIRSPSTSNAITFTVTPSSWVTRRLAVDRTLQDGQVGRRAGPIDEELRYPRSTFDRVRLGSDDAATIAGCRCVRVEDGNQCVDVLGLPRPLEVPDDVGALSCRCCRSRRRANATTGRRGQLSTCRRRAADDLGHVRKRVAEDIVKDERDALCRGHRIEHDEERHIDRLVEGDAVRRVDDATARSPVDPLGPGVW
jgi:hypothetical protein